MKLSTRARYALRLMADIAGNSSADKPMVSLTDVSKRTRISRRYLEQLCITLRSAFFLRSKTGKGGGYSLTRPADTIKITHIIEAVIGPINVVECVLYPNACIMSGDCKCRAVYCEINKRIAGVLSDLTLEDLVKDKFTDCSNRPERE